MTKSKPNRINEEEVCIDSLVYYLKTFCNCHDVNVLKEIKDPPDYWLTIDGENYAAEVTSIVNQQDVSFHNWCKSLKDSIKEIVKQETSISGTYILLVKGEPRIPKKQSKDWRRLIQACINIISTLESSPLLDERILYKDKRGHLKIVKSAEYGSTVGLIGPTHCKWEGDAEMELRDLMQKSLAAKNRKLNNKKLRMNCAGVIILFYDAYGFGNIDITQKALLNTDTHDRFHSIFWASSFTNRNNELFSDQPGRIGKSIFSKNRDWWTE